MTVGFHYLSLPFWTREWEPKGDPSPDVPIFWRLLAITEKEVVQIYVMVVHLDFIMMKAFCTAFLQEG